MFSYVMWHKPLIILLISSSLNQTLQVIIGSPILKANQSLNQVIEVVKVVEKYTRYKVVISKNQADNKKNWSLTINFSILCRLIRLLKEMMDINKILIFVETMKGCDQVTLQLRMDGRRALSIHGNKS